MRDAIFIYIVHKYIAVVDSRVFERYSIFPPRNKVWLNNVATRYERHLTTDACVSLSIFHQNVELGSNTISSKVQRFLSSPVVKPFLVQEFESFVRETVLLPLSNRIPSAGSRTTKRTRTARYTAISQPKI